MPSSLEVLIQRAESLAYDIEKTLSKGDTVSATSSISTAQLLVHLLREFDNKNKIVSEADKPTETIVGLTGTVRVSDILAIVSKASDPSLWSLQAQPDNTWAKAFKIDTNAKPTKDLYPITASVVNSCPPVITTGIWDGTPPLNENMAWGNTTVEAADSPLGDISVDKLIESVAARAEIDFAKSMNHTLDTLRDYDAQRTAQPVARSMQGYNDEPYGYAQSLNR